SDGKTVVYGAAWEGGPFQLFRVLPGEPTSSPFGLNANLLAVGPEERSTQGVEMAISKDHRFLSAHMGLGTLARKHLGGDAPRDELDDVQEADFPPDGDLALIRRVDGEHRLEYPKGNPLIRRTGWISHARFSPSGDALAFFEHPVYGDDRGWVVLLR